MIKLYHAPLSRSLRILWLLEELGLPYELETMELLPPAPAPFAQRSPLGKFPTIEDGDVTMFESGAILEYVLERYGDGRLAPPADSPLRATFLQWVHFAESTLFSGMGAIAWHTRFREDAEKIPEAIEDYRTWTRAALATLDRALDGRDYLLGPDFSGADIMVGYSVLVAGPLGLLTDEFPNVNVYLARLAARPALRRALGADASGENQRGVP